MFWKILFSLIITYLTITKFYYIHLEYDNTYYDLELERNSKAIEQGIYVNTTPLAPVYKKTKIIRLLDEKQCNLLIHDANCRAKNSNGWQIRRHDNYPTTDMELKNILSFPVVNNRLHIILSEIEKQFDVPSDLLLVTDLFIARYDNNKQNSLKRHTDGSEYSFVIALNDNFEGGGTRINSKDIKLKTGECLIFCGKNYHSGIKVVSGVRYIIAGFIEIISKDWYQSTLSKGVNIIAK